MSIWDPLDTRLTELKKTYARIKSRYDHQRTAVNNEHDHFVNKLTEYRKLTIYNSALFVVGNAIKMTNDQFDQLIEQTSIPAPGIHDNNAIPQAIREDLERKTGGVYIINAIYEMHKIGTDPNLSSGFDKFASGLIAVQDVLYGLACGGIGALPGGDAIPDGLRQILSLPLQAAAFIGAVALDIITGPFQLAEEEREYEEAIRKLDDALRRLDNTYYTIRNAISIIERESRKQRGLFASIMKRLNEIKPATFDVNINFEITDVRTLFAYQSSAMEEYGLLINIRTDWKNIRENSPTISESDFKHFELTALSRKNFTKQQLEELIELVLNPTLSSASLLVSGHNDRTYNGKYLKSGIYNGKPFYKKADSEHYIFYKKETNEWIMQPSPPSPEWKANTYARGEDPTNAIGWRKGIEVVYSR